MTAALLVLGPIFEADLPSEIYAYRAARNAQQAVVEVEELLFRGVTAPTEPPTIAPVAAPRPPPAIPPIAAPTPAPTSPLPTSSCA